MSHGLLLAGTWGEGENPWLPPNSSSLECKVAPHAPWPWHLSDWAIAAYGARRTTV